MKVIERVHAMLAAEPGAIEERRRLSRYDEAIQLLREIASYEPLSDSDGGFINTWSEIEAFLAADPKKGSDHE